MAIKAEQLRVATLEALREAASREPETRRVSNDRRISYGGRTFDLSMVPGVVAGLKVTMQVNVFRHPAIDVQFTDQDTGEVSWHVVEPMVQDQWGFGPGPVIGQEMRTAAYSDVDRNRNRLTKTAYDLPTVEEADAARKRHAQAYAGRVDAMADVHATQVPTYIPKRGTPLATPQVPVHAPRLNVAAACKRIRQVLGAAYSPQVYAWVEARFPDGVPEDQLAGICASFAPAQAAQPGQAAGLRAVGGGQ